MRMQKLNIMLGRASNPKGRKKEKKKGTEKKYKKCQKRLTKWQ